MAHLLRVSSKSPTCRVILPVVLFGPRAGFALSGPAWGPCDAILTIHGSVCASHVG